MTTRRLALALGLLAGVIPARAELPCPLTSDDRAELAASEAQLTSDAAIEALPPAKQATLCRSIRTIHALMDGAKLKNSRDASSFYLGPAYSKIFADALNDYLAALFAAQGLRARNSK